MHLEPEGRAAAADVGKIGPLAAIANERGALAVDLGEALQRVPKGGCRWYQAEQIANGS